MSKAHDFKPDEVNRAVKRAAGLGARTVSTRAEGPEGWWRTVVRVRPGAGPGVWQTLLKAGYTTALLSGDGQSVTIDHPRPW